MVLGHGIDLVEVARIRSLHEAHGQRFLDRCFTPGEQVICGQMPRRRHERLAGRFAAKEAVLKALGTGLRHGIAWTEIEVLPDPAGTPRVTLTGRARHIAAERGITRWTISITHVNHSAMASAIAE